MTQLKVNLREARYHLVRLAKQTAVQNLMLMKLRLLCLHREVMGHSITRSNGAMAPLTGTSLAKFQII